MLLYMNMNVRIHVSKCISVYVHTFMFPTLRSSMNTGWNPLSLKLEQIPKTRFCSQLYRPRARLKSRKAERY